MTLVAARDGLAGRLATLTGLRVYSLPPETTPELPAAIIQPGQPLAEYDGTLAGDDVTFRFTVLLLTGSGDDEQAWQEVAGYVAPSGAGSVKAAVESASGADAGVDWFRVVRAVEGGRVTYRKATYWGVTFQVQAYVSG